MSFDFSYTVILTTFKSKRINKSTLETNLILFNKYFEENQYALFSGEENFTRRKFKIEPITLSKFLFVS